MWSSVLLALLLVVVAACGDSDPAEPVEPTNTIPASADPAEPTATTPPLADHDCPDRFIGRIGSRFALSPARITATREGALEV